MNQKEWIKNILHHIATGIYAMRKHFVCGFLVSKNWVDIKTFLWTPWAASDILSFKRLISSSRPMCLFIFLSDFTFIWWKFVHVSPFSAQLKRSCLNWTVMGPNSIMDDAKDLMFPSVKVNDQNGKNWRNWLLTTVHFNERPIIYSWTVHIGPGLF